MASMKQEMVSISFKQKELRDEVMIIKEQMSINLNEKV